MTDTPEAIEAAKLYQTLLTKCGAARRRGLQLGRMPVGLPARQGRHVARRRRLRAAAGGPEKSRVVGKVGYGVMPSGPKAQASATFGDGIGVTAASKNKEAAYLYCQWAVSKLMGARLLQAGGGVPFRNSILNDPEVRKGVKHAGGLARRGRRVRQDQPAGLPVIIPVTEFRDIMGVGLTNLLGGGDPAAELKKATEQFRPVLERSEKA